MAQKSEEEKYFKRLQILKTQQQKFEEESFVLNFDFGNSDHIGAHHDFDSSSLPSVKKLRSSIVYYLDMIFELSNGTNVFEEWKFLIRGEEALQYPQGIFTNYMNRILASFYTPPSL